MADRTGPYDRPPRARLDDSARRELLGRALRGIERGAYDEWVVAWLAGQDPAVVRSIAGMVERARQLERAAARPLRGASLDDFLTLLDAVRDALTAGHGDLAALVLHPLLEHRSALGKRSRAAAALLRSQLADRARGPRAGGIRQGESACKPASVPPGSDPWGWRSSIWDRRRRRPQAVHQGTRPGQPPAAASCVAAASPM